MRQSKSMPAARTADARRSLRRVYHCALEVIVYSVLVAQAAKNSGTVPESSGQPTPAHQHSRTRLLHSFSSTAAPGNPWREPEEGRRPTAPPRTDEAPSRSLPAEQQSSNGIPVRSRFRNPLRILSSALGRLPISWKHGWLTPVARTGVDRQGFDDGQQKGGGGRAGRLRRSQTLGRQRRPAGDEYFTGNTEEMKDLESAPRRKRGIMQSLRRSLSMNAKDSRRQSLIRTQPVPPSPRKGIVHVFGEGESQELTSLPSHFGTESSSTPAGGWLTPQPSGHQESDAEGRRDHRLSRSFFEKPLVSPPSHSSFEWLGTPLPVTEVEEDYGAPDVDCGRSGRVPLPPPKNRVRPHQGHQKDMGTVEPIAASCFPAASPRAPSQLAVNIRPDGGMQRPGTSSACHRRHCSLPESTFCTQDSSRPGCRDVQQRRREEKWPSVKHLQRLQTYPRDGCCATLPRGGNASVYPANTTHTQRVSALTKALDTWGISTGPWSDRVSWKFDKHGYRCIHMLAL